MFALIEIPLVCYLFAPGRSRAMVDRFDAWLRRNARGLAAGLAGVVGVFLVVKGLVRLV